MAHASTVAAGSRTLPGKASKMADVAAGSSANLCSSDEFSSDGEVEITSDMSQSMFQKLRAPKVSDRGRKRKIQCNSLEDYLEASIMLQFNHR